MYVTATTLRIRAIASACGTGARSAASSGARNAPAQSPSKMLVSVMPTCTSGRTRSRCSKSSAASSASPIPSSAIFSSRPRWLSTSAVSAREKNAPTARSAAIKMSRIPMSMPSKKYAPPYAPIQYSDLYLLRSTLRATSFCLVPHQMKKGTNAYYPFLYNLRYESNRFRIENRSSKRAFDAFPCSFRNPSFKIIASSCVVASSND